MGAVPASEQLAQPGSRQATGYDHLHAEAGQVRFVEDDGVPSDASQVGATWRYVNKKGGPDKRFNNNRQLPIMLYDELLLASASGVRELFESRFRLPL